MGQDILGPGQRLGDQRGGGDGDQRFVHEFQVRYPRPVLPTVMDGGIKTRPREIERAQAGGKVQRDLGMRLGKARQARGQPMHPEGGQDGKGQAAAERVGAQGQRGRGQQMQGLAHFGHIIGPGGGQAQALAVAQEQGNAKLRLEPLQRAADGALRQAQLLGGGGGGSKAVHRLQRHQGGDCGQVAAGQHYEFSS